jgi:hypothetical protein
MASAKAQTKENADQDAKQRPKRKSLLHPTPMGEDNEECLHLAVENRNAFDSIRHMAAA